MIMGPKCQGRKTVAYSINHTEQRFHWLKDVFQKDWEQLPKGRSCLTNVREGQVRAPAGELALEHCDICNQRPKMTFKPVHKYREQDRDNRDLLDKR